MLGLSPSHLIIIMIVALIVVGPARLPEVGAAIGKSVREFQKATSGITDGLTGAATTPAPQAQAPLTQAPPPAQSYYAAQPTYPAPVAPAPPQYPVMDIVAPAPPQYPVMDVVAPVFSGQSAQPTPMNDLQPDGTVQQPPAPAKID
jgi:sec-independent protein translocase protein TatA